jgi:hypothetical protein
MVSSLIYMLTFIRDWRGGERMDALSKLRGKRGAE